MMLNRSIFFMLAAVASLWANWAQADNGMTALAITCDKSLDYFKLEPTILWNEDLDKFLVANPKGVGKEDHVTTYLMGQFVPFPLIKKCVLQSTTIEVRTDFTDQLTVKDSGNVILAKEIGLVWKGAGFWYYLEHTQTKAWSECCGSNAKSNVCEAPNKKTSTDYCIN